AHGCQSTRRLCVNAVHNPLRSEESMSHVRWSGALGTFALLAGLGSNEADAQQIKTVFVIAMENHNWTQPANQFTGTIQQIFQNTNAPSKTSLADGSAYAIINAPLVNISDRLSYATNSRSVLAPPAATTRTSIRPSRTTSGRKPAPTSAC